MAKERWWLPEGAKDRRSGLTEQSKVALRQRAEQQALESGIPHYKKRGVETTVRPELWKAYQEARQILGMNNYRFVQYCIHRVLRDMFRKNLIQEEVPPTTKMDVERG